MSQERNSALSQSVRPTQMRLVTMVVLIGEALEFLYQMPIYRLQGANYIFFKMRDFDNSKKKAEHLLLFHIIAESQNLHFSSGNEHQICYIC